MRTGYASIGLVLLGAAAPASAACTGEGRHDPMALRQICDMEKAWGQSLVKGDPAVARRILADDFLGVDTKGKLYRKADEIADVPRVAQNMAADTMNDVIVRFYGDTALAQGSDSWIGKDGSKGRFVWTDTWLKRTGEWRIVAAEDLIPPEGK